MKTKQPFVVYQFLIRDSSSGGWTDITIISLFIDGKKRLAPELGSSGGEPATYIVASTCRGKAGIIMYPVSSPNAWGWLREGGSDGHLSLLLLFVGVGMNSLGLVVQAEVRLVVGLGGGVRWLVLGGVG